MISWLARVRVAAVPVRAAPGADQPVETVGPGAGPTDPSTVIQVVLGDDAWVIAERQVKGETWYEVATSGSVYWIPAGPAANPTLARFELADCPSSPAETWTALIDHPMRALACFGDRPLTLVVYWLTIEEQYRSYPCTERHWINCFEYVSLVGDGRSRVPPAGQQVAPELQISLATELTNPLRGQWVALTGHLDDPRSPDCPRTLGYLEDPGAMAWAILACRTRFVADSVVSAPKP